MTTNGTTLMTPLQGPTKRRSRQSNALVLLSAMFLTLSQAIVITPEPLVSQKLNPGVSDSKRVKIDDLTLSAYNGLPSGVQGEVTPWSYSQPCL
jgi:hypothetical protein